MGIWGRGIEGYLRNCVGEKINILKIEIFIVFLQCGSYWQYTYYSFSWVVALLSKTQHGKLHNRSFEQTGVWGTQIAPSGCNAQPWRFKIVTDHAINDKLMRAAKNQKLLLKLQLFWYL